MPDDIRCNFRLAQAEKDLLAKRGDRLNMSYNSYAQLIVRAHLAIENGYRRRPVWESQGRKTADPLPKRKPKKKKKAKRKKKAKKSKRGR